MNTGRTVALGAVVVVLLVTAVYVGIQQGVLTGPPPSTSTSTTTLTTSTSITTLTSITTGASSSSSSGLELQLGVNASSSAADNSVALQIRVSEYNTLATANNVSASKQWALSGVSLGTCGTTIYPFGVVLYRGSYASANASAATPLKIYPVVACPLMIRLVTGYLFQPTSNVAVVLPSGPNGIATPMSVNLTASAEYAGGPGASASSTPLAPGTYTLAAADEWGSVTFIHIAIGLGASVSSSGTGVRGTLQAVFDVGPTQPVCRVNATTGPAPAQYSSIGAVVTSQPSGVALTFPISWLSNGCSVSGSLQTSLAPGAYSLNLSSCQWMGCSNSLPKSFTVTAGQSTTVNVSIDTGIR